MSYRFFAIPACRPGAAEADLNQLAGQLPYRGPSPAFAGVAAAFVAFMPLRPVDGNRQFPL